LGPDTHALMLPNVTAKSLHATSKQQLRKVSASEEEGDSLRDPRALQASKPVSTKVFTTIETPRWTPLLAREWALSVGAARK